MVAPLRPPSTLSTYACATLAAGRPPDPLRPIASSVSLTHGGLTTLTRTRRGISSAAACANASTAALVREKAALPGTGSPASTPLVSVNEPPSATRARPRRTTFTCPISLLCSPRWKSSSESSSSGLKLARPAAHTTASKLPTASYIRAMDSADSMSTRWSPCERAARTTSCPRPASASATALPMVPVAPMTMIFTADLRARVRKCLGRESPDAADPGCGGGGVGASGSRRRPSRAADRSAPSRRLGRLRVAALVALPQPAELDVAGGQVARQVGDPLGHLQDGAHPVAPQLGDVPVARLEEHPLGRLQLLDGVPDELPRVLQVLLGGRFLVGHADRGRGWRRGRRRPDLPQIRDFDSSAQSEPRFPW